MSEQDQLIEIDPEGQAEGEEIDLRAEALDGLQETVPRHEAEDELPDELLSESERAEKTARTDAKKAEADRAAAREGDDRTIRLLTEAFGRLAPQQAAPEQPQQPTQQRPLTKEQRVALNQKILEDDEGVLKAVEWAKREGRAEAISEFRRDTASAAGILGESVAEKFGARKMRESDMGKAIMPAFEKLLDEFDVSSLAGMSREDRERSLSDLWLMAGGKVLESQGKVRSVSPGVSRGAGGSGNARRGGFKRQPLPDNVKESMMATATTEEGRKRMERYILEIEYGVTSDQNIARMVNDNMKIAENARAVI